MKQKDKIIEELSLIRNIIKYIVIDDSKNVEKEHEKQSKLEEEISKSKIKKEPSDSFLEEVLFELKNNKGSKDFSFDVKKERKEIEEAQRFVVKYKENEKEQVLKVEGGEGEEKYSLEIVKEKKDPDEKPYEFSITYESSKTEERIRVKYNLRDYPTEREHALQDFTNVLDKTLHIMPKSIMGGVLGYTYLGENFMARRDDLIGDTALMVDVHEAIHTSNEYETRVLTSWILSRERVKYKR